MDCGSLENVVQSGGCANEAVLSSIAFQMISGLAFLHEKRLIHRDVKPSNALISSDGCVKLADFGLARTLDSGQSVANSFVGTFLYMSPERLTGEGYSFQSDIWSAGLTIHAVAVGHFPYVGKTGYWEVLHATQQGPPTVASNHSAALRAFLSLAYQIDVQQRASAATLLAQAFVRPTTPGALDTIPPPLRHLVCHLMASEEETSNIVSSIKIPVIGTPAGSMPQSAPCTTTGNLTFRTPLESAAPRSLWWGRHAGIQAASAAARARH
jgi:serine/threonine protein kinase